MKKIHLFVLSLNEVTGGGSHHNAISYVRFLKEKNYQVVVHTLTAGNNFPPADIEIVEHKSGLSLSEMMSASISLLKEYESDADLFFLYGVDFSWAGGIFRKQGGKVPVVVYLDNYLHSMNAGQWQGYPYYLKRLLWDKTVGLQHAKHVDRFLAVSPFLQDKYVRFGFPKKKFSVIPNFFEIDITREKTPKNSDVLNLLYTGRITYDKGTDMLLEVLARIPAQYKWRLRIVGEGSARLQCQALTKFLQLESKITFIPWEPTDLLTKEYALADIFVHPARWPEPFGRTIVESLEYGVPVIVPTLGGAAWIAKDAGIEFKNGDSDSLCAAILALLKDKDLRERLGAVGKERIAMFSKDVVGSELKRVLDSLLNSG